jgi:glycosyltransferase involved in cell wall biosynthesis
MKEIQKISILLPTFNCQTSVRASLASVEWADEIIVIDSFSDDDTIKIASKYGARIFQHEYINSAKQKNWSLQHCSHEWVFQIDSDEILEGKAEEIIRDAISYEMARNGQAFFVHNRIENIKEVAGLLQRLCPDAKIRVGHGQMEGKKLEELMIDFMEIGRAHV